MNISKLPFKSVFVTGFYLLFLFFSGNLYALETYLIEDVETEASGMSATEARMRAIEEGERKAFELLVKQLDITDIPKIDNAKISQIVVDYSIKSEKIRPGNYEAKIDFSFNKKLVNEILGLNKSAEVLQNDYNTPHLQEKVTYYLSFGSLNDYNKIKSKLYSLKSLKQLKLKKLSIKEAEIEFLPTVSEEEVIKEINEKGLIITKNNGKIFLSNF